MKNSKGTLIFCLALSIYLATMMLDASMFGCMQLFGMVSKGMRYISYLLLCWKILDDSDYTLGELLKYVLCAGVTILVYLVSGEKGIIFILLFLIACKNVFFSTVLKIALWTNGICMAVIAFCYKIGILPDRFAIDGSRERHSLGYDFPTTGSNYWMYFIFLYVCYRKNRITFWEAAVLEAIAYFYYALTDTKSAFAISTLTLLLALGLKVWNGQQGRLLFGLLIRYITWIGGIIIGLLVFLYDKMDFVKITINNLLTTRIQLSFDALQTYRIQLFGQKIEWVGGTMYYEKEWRPYNYVDSSYIQILLTYGVILLALIFVAYYLLGREIVAVKDWYFGLVIVMVAVHSTFDPQLLRMQYNVFLLALGYLFISDKVERRKYLFGYLE